MADYASLIRPTPSIVIHLWKEVAAALERHVEQAPERVDQIAGAMVLLRRGRGKAHFRAPDVPDRTVLLLEDVEDRFVPILAVRDLVLRAHSLGKFRRVAKIIRVVAVARGRQQRKMVPAAFVRP